MIFKTGLSAKEVTRSLAGLHKQAVQVPLWSDLRLSPGLSPARWANMRGFSLHGPAFCNDSGNPYLTELLQ